MSRTHSTVRRHQLAIDRPEVGRPDRVERHMVSPMAGEAEERVESVLSRIREGQFPYAGTVFVLDAGRLVGQVPLPSLLAAPPELPIRELMADMPVSVSPESDQEHAATMAIGHRSSAVPVVADGGRLVGVLPPEALMEILRAEHLEDLHRLAGIARDQQMAREAIESPPLRRERHRLPWLLIGLAGSAAATLIMAAFETTLQATVAVAFFVPGMIYLADAIGTQTEAAAVRGLSFTREPLPQLVGGELRTGLLMGLTLAALTLPAAWVGFGDVSLAIAVAASLLAASGVATTIGLLLPWLLWHFGRDPAYGSGPLATVIQDVLSIVIYLTIVTLIVG